ncbi:MAG: PQQ-binding-like beta-propeller repeat protein [Chloroflexi bacterium]|nr:PQQ-binding-like beta-propeller repeat protein [Chloroflexota bacterium]
MHTSIVAVSSLASAPPMITPSPVQSTSAEAFAPPSYWMTYHGSNARLGAALTDLHVTSINKLWQSQQLGGDVYAEPLSDGESVYVVTEQNQVYSLRLSTGAVQWVTSLGNPEPRSQLPCGNISPLGITSTPVIDAATHEIFVVAEMSGATHELFALDSATGRVLHRTNIDPPGAEPRYLQQRAALSLGVEAIYVAFGGLDGDCGPYHGYVASISPASFQVEHWYQVPTQREGAIWAPSGPAIDGAGNVFVTTGNGSSISVFDYGNTVIKLSPALTVLDWFAPANWALFNRRDLDLGSVGPALLSSRLLFQVGKAGIGYLLDPAHLGHLGGALYEAEVCPGALMAFGGVAYADSRLFVPCQSGLVALEVHAKSSSFTTTWTAGGLFAESPIVTGDVVWTVDRTHHQLHGFAAATGRQRFSVDLPMQDLPHFITPSVAGRTLLLAAGRTIYAWTIDATPTSR